MLLNYKENNPTGRPRKKLSITKNDQAVVYDFLMNDTTATQAAHRLEMNIASFRHFVSYVVQYWIDIRFVGFTKSIKSVNDFEEREV